MLKSGRPAPDFTLRTLEGEAFSLHDIRNGGEQALLIFLRHLG